MTDQGEAAAASSALAARVYTLDCCARHLVGVEIREFPDRDPRDLVNAGIYFLLGNEDRDSSACKAKARAWRLAQSKGAA